MNGILAWFARNGVAANILMGLIVVGGLLSVRAIPTQTLPELSYGVITVAVPYPGASPADVDEAVCARVAEKLQGLKTIRRVHSLAVEGLCYTRAYVIHGADVRQALDDLKTRIDAIDSFPEDVEEPVVQELDPPERAMSLVISGRADERTLTILGERMRDEITALPDVTLVTLAGVRPYEISIEVSEDVLRRHGLTFSQLAQAVRRSSLNLPGGSINTRDAEILLRTQGQASEKHEFEDLVLLKRQDGTRLTLGEVARVSDGFVESVDELRFDREPAVRLDVFGVGSEDNEIITARIDSYLAQAQPRLPDGVRVTVWQDVTLATRDRLATLLSNGRDGLFLVLAVLALFLRPRLAGWVAWGIPFSFLGTLWAMLALDHSLNQLSLLGFIIVLGIVVDDAIVVGENIYRHHHSGKDGVRAAIDGVCEVATPVFFAVLTTIATFTPLMNLPGILGQQMRAIPIVVILCLVFSLTESLLILPSHLSHLRQKEPLEGEPSATVVRRSPWQRLQTQVNSLLVSLIQRLYLPAVERALAWRYSTLAVAVALLLLSVGLVAGGRIPFLFFPPIDSQYLTVGLILPQGTPAEATKEALGKIEDSAFELGRQFEEEGKPGLVRNVHTVIGALPAGRIQFSDLGRLERKGSHLGGVTISLPPGNERTLSTTEIGRRLRELVGTIPDAVELSYGTSVMEAGKAIEVLLAGNDLEELQLAAGSLKGHLGAYPGVHSITESLRIGKREARLSVTPEGEALGIDLADISQQVRQAFHGEEVQRFQRGRHELKVMVRYPESDRRLLASLEDMRIRTPGGDEVPFAVAGRVRHERGLAVIERTDGRWTVRVGADVDRDQADGNEIVHDLQLAILPELAADHPGLTFSFAGEQQEQRETLGALGRNTLLVLFLVYALLAIASGSYLQPLLIMGAIPFGLIGAILGHLLLGFPLTISSLLGVVALSGVVVNDSLVLVDFINRARRDEGVLLDDALRRAGEVRFRPIVLMSLTTFAGLTPLLFETSVQGQYLIPIGISLAFGVLFGTLISLILVPVGYKVLDDLSRLFEGRSTQTGT